MTSKSPNQMSDSDGKVESEDNVILHVAVLGFHHKKGTVLEYSYPPLTDGQPHSSSQLPPCWSCLPALALPDGAHQHDEGFWELKCLSKIY